MRRVFLAVAAVVAVFGSVLGASPASGADPDTTTTTSVAFAGARFGDVVADPTTGSVLVLADDRLVIFDAAGTEVGAVALGGRAAAASRDGRTLWVALDDVDRLVRVDLDAGAVAAVVDPGVDVGASLQVIGGAVWFTSGPTAHQGLVRYDPATGAAEARGGDRHAARLVAIPGRTDRAVFHDTGLNPSTAALLDLSVDPVAVLAEVPDGALNSLHEMVAIGAGPGAAADAVVAAAENPYAAVEFSLADLAETDRYAASHYPVAVDVSAGVVAVGTRVRKKLFVHRPDDSEAGPDSGVPLEIDAGGSVLARSVVVAPGGTAVHWVTQESATSLRLHTHPLSGESSAVVESLSPRSGPMAGGTSVTITGAGLASTTKVHFGDVETSFSIVDDATITANAPARSVAGSVAVRVTTAAGPATGLLAYRYLPSDGERFVRAAYDDFLGRAPTVSELSRWSGPAGSASGRGDLVRALAYSDEWVGRVVDGYYRDTLGRPADTGGRRFWVGRITSGALTPAKVAAEFYASTEYYRRTGGTDEEWVDDLYARLLRRAPDSSGRAYWLSVARSSGRQTVTLSFFQSIESRLRRVTSIYVDLLGRRPDASGGRYWADVILDSGNDVDLAVFIASSEEYRLRALRRY